jgi:PST family polysaccharide transporter
LVRFGFGLAGTQSIAYVTRNGDNVALGYFWGPAIVGIYSLAYNIVMMPMNQVLVPLTRVAVPLLGKVRDDSVQLMENLQTAQTITTSAACVMYGAVVGFADPIVRLVFGEQWLEAVPIIQLMALGGIFRAMGQVSYWLFIVRGHSIEQLKFHLVAQPATLAIMLIGIPWGGVGVAMGLSAGYAVLWLTQLFWVGRVAKLDTGILIENGFKCLLIVGLPYISIPILANRYLESPTAVAVAVIFLAFYSYLVMRKWQPLKDNVLILRVNGMKIIKGSRDQ